MSGRKKPSALSDVLAGVLRDSGIAERVEQARLIPEWPALVGAQIAAVTEPTSIAADGTMFVRVTTNAWMNELSLMEPELIRVLNIHASARRVKKIRFELKR